MACYGLSWPVLACEEGEFGTTLNAVVVVDITVMGVVGNVFAGHSIKDGLAFREGTRFPNSLLLRIVEKVQMFEGNGIELEIASKAAAFFNPFTEIMANATAAENKIR